MARENQGLHAALIVFVVLTIILAVTTFVFFSQYNDANKKAEDYKRRGDENENLARDKDKSLIEFQQMMGFAPTDTPETVRDRFNDDMTKYAPRDLDDQSRVYREVVKRQDEIIKDTDQNYRDEVDKVKKLEETLAGINALVDAKIAQFESRAKEAETDHQREAKKFAEDSDRLKQMQETLADDLSQTKKDATEQLGLKEKLIADLKQDVNTITDAYEVVKKTVDKMTQEIPDQFQGEIALVDQRSGTVWINRGHDDALRPQTKFSVFPAGSGNVSEVEKKASIEITRVLGGHLAEARILDNSPLDPIQVGDKIYTPIWNVGQRRHVALVGIIDLDGDGRSDLQRMHTLVEMNGGVVDAPMDAQGTRHGKMTMDTRYLIVGKEFEASSAASLREDYVKITAESEKLRIETITLEKFLELMGWVRQIQVARFGSGEDFPVERATSPSVSSGQISERYKPRHPPRSSKSTGY